jgi:hypothetical protein
LTIGTLPLRGQQRAVKPRKLNKGVSMLGVAHVVDTDLMELHDKRGSCGQGQRWAKVARMDDGSIECFDYYRYCGRGSCRDCPVKEGPQGILTKKN